MEEVKGLSFPILSGEIMEEFQNQRNIVIAETISDDLALKVMLLLRHMDQQSNDPIYLYINSGGGSVTAGLTIVDNMALVKSPIYTVCYGIAASMAAVIFASGEKGHRYMTAHSELMIHQPWSNASISGLKETDLVGIAEEMSNTRRKLETILSDASGKSLDEIHIACEKDNYLDPEEAIAMGLADKVIQSGKTGKVEG